MIWVRANICGMEDAGYIRGWLSSCPQTGTINQWLLCNSSPLACTTGQTTSLFNNCAISSSGTKLKAHHHAPSLNFDTKCIFAFLFVLFFLKSSRIVNHRPVLKKVWVDYIIFILIFLPFRIPFMVYLISWFLENFGFIMYWTAIG